MNPHERIADTPFSAEKVVTPKEPLSERFFTEELSQEEIDAIAKGIHNNPQSKRLFMEGVNEELFNLGKEEGKKETHALVKEELEKITNFRILLDGEFVIIRKEDWRTFVREKLT